MALRPGERVAVVVKRHPDPNRWDMARLGDLADEDDALASAGLAEWAESLDHGDGG